MFIREVNINYFTNQVVIFKGFLLKYSFLLMNHFANLPLWLITHNFKRIHTWNVK